MSPMLISCATTDLCWACAEEIEDARVNGLGVAGIKILIYESARDLVTAFEEDPDPNWADLVDSFSLGLGAHLSERLEDKQ